MEIHIIAVWNPLADDPWIVDAWDEWSIDDNREGFEEAVKKHQKEQVSNSEVRVGIVNVPDSFLKDMFKSHEVTGEVKNHGAV